MTSPVTSTSKDALASPASFSAKMVYIPSSSRVTFLIIRVLPVGVASRLRRPCGLIFWSSLFHAIVGLGIPLTPTGILSDVPLRIVIKSLNLLSYSNFGTAEITKK